MQRLLSFCWTDSTAAHLQSQTERNREETRMEEVLLSIIALSGLCAVSSHAERQYRVVYDPKDWSEAQSYCRERYTDLATVDNMEDVNTLINMTDASKLVSHPEAWIGLYRGTHSFKWSDGSSYSFRYWLPLEPDNKEGIEDCVVQDFIYSGQWGDLSCSTRRAFICYGTLTNKQVFRVKFHTQDSSLDPNDPAVMEDTLKKLKQKLQDQGLDDNIKLSWRKQPDRKVFHKEEKKKKKTKKDEL